MKDAVAFLLLGLGSGAFFAILAMGVVIAYRGSGVINFAQGAIATFCAFQFYSLRRRGTFVLPWIDVLPTHRFNIPVNIGIGKADSTGARTLAFVPSLLLAVLTSVALGALVHYLVFRPLRNAAPLGKVIGSLGLMLYLQGVVLKNFGTENPQPATVLPQDLFRNFLGLGKTFSKENFWLTIIAIIAGIGLWVLYRYTRFGLATRAAAGNEKGAVLLGYSPDRLALANWIVASVSAGIGGVLVGSITGAMNPVKFTTLMVPVLGAALIGRLSSVPLALVGGLVIGMLQSFSTTWLTARSWFPVALQSAARDVPPFVVIVGVLILRGRSLPIRGTVEERKLPLSPYPTRVWQHCAIFGGAAIAFSYWAEGTKWGFPLSVSLITSMVMLSYVVLTGYVGQISLAQMSSAGVAAFFMARMMADGSVSTLSPFPVRGPHLPWPIAAPLGIIVAVAVGVVVGLPALRIRGVQLAVVTLAAAVLLQTLYFENPKFTDLRAGSNAEVKAPHFFGIDVGSFGKSGLNDNPSFTIFCVIVLCLLCAGVANLRRSGTGRRLLAVRANERAAAAAGVDVVRTKMLAFAIASAIAGVAGVMTAFQQVTISSANWPWGFSLAALAFCYLGGITSIAGAVIGGLIFANGLIVAASNHFYNGITSYTTIIGGAAMIFTAIRQPAGIAPTFQPLVQYFGRWLLRARGREWAKAIRHFAPGALVAMALVSLLLWAKANEFRNWFLLLVPVAGLFLRGLGLELWTGVKGALTRRKGRVPGPTSETRTLAEQGA